MAWVRTPPTWKCACWGTTEQPRPPQRLSSWWRLPSRRPGAALDGLAPTPSIRLWIRSIQACILAGPWGRDSPRLGGCLVRFSHRDVGVQSTSLCREGVRHMTRNSRRNGAWAISLTLGLVVAGAPPLWSQATGTIEGRVTAEVTAQPIMGARIYLVENPRVQTNTGQDGRYALRGVPAGTQVVRVSMLGFSRVEASVAVGPGQVAALNVTLRRAVISLDEVVVTGTAGAQERRTIGNSVGSIGVAEIEAAPVANAVEALTARVPGLTLMANSGQAGSSSNIRIRGAGSLSAGYAPVFYVDGIRIESGLVESASTYQGGTALDFLNPDDIESIEVIKGPAAATLYGAEAANGVIQVITKKGRRGTQSTRWSASLEMGQNEWTKDVGSNETYWRCTGATALPYLGTPANQQTNTAGYPGCAAAAGNFPPDSVQWWGKDANGDAQLFSGIPAEDIIDAGDGTFVMSTIPCSGTRPLCGWA